MRIKVLLAVLAFLLAVPASAHSGGTDSQGGHHDYKNVSGLGSYHYHHGMGPHLHPNGVCPYASGSSGSNFNSTYTEPESEPVAESGTGLEYAYEEDLVVARSVGYEEYGDYNFFSHYDPDLEVFFNDYGDIYLDVTREDIAIGVGFGEILRSRGYLYSDGIWYDEYGYYYEGSWEYSSWDQLEKEMEDAGVDICDECGNVIADKYEDHSDYCPNNPYVIEEQEAEEAREEARKESIESIIWSGVFLFGFYGIFSFIDYLDRRKFKK